MSVTVKCSVCASLLMPQEVPMQPVVWSFLLPPSSILHKRSARCHSYTGREWQSVAVIGALHLYQLCFIAGKYYFFKTYFKCNLCLNT